VDLLGWVIFLVALMFSVMLHETGHFVMAKKFGMQATRYFVGFGPTLWSTQRGETEYGVKALPLGGFVKITGMTSMDEVDPVDEPRSFRQAPGRQRLIVLVAGSFMHFVLAAVLIFGLAVGLGSAVENYNTTQLGTVSSCVPASLKDYNNGICKIHDAKSPAVLAGLRVGDKVVAVDGRQVTNFHQLTSQIDKNTKPGSTVALTVLRDGHQLTLHSKLAAVKGRSGSYLGVAPPVVFQRASPVQAITSVGSAFWQVLDGSGHALAQLPKAIPNLFKSDRSSTAAGNVSSVVGAARATGQVVAANLGWQYKVSYVLLLIASLNIFVGVLNLLPLLPMDGGHVAVVLYEMIRGWLARLRGRANPGLVDYRKLVPVSFSVFMVLVVFGMMLILADIVNPVSIG
jgi:membrane-associated protease RseP (regulator of RpoE activity)